jgi:RNA 3'-terminal phosphate cyclase (ATP)
MTTIRAPALGERPLVIDGAHGEGGGEILRTALSLSVITGRSVTLVNIRAGRPKPGLAAQHLTAVRAAAALCAAEVIGAELGALTLAFVPQTKAFPGCYAFDAAEAREGGSAGAATLVLQTILLPLALADGQSTVTLRGGTHIRSSPSFDYVLDIWLPILGSMGVSAVLELMQAGWFPIGRGEMTASIAGSARLLRPINCRQRGDLGRVWGRALTANLPSHVAQRMTNHAERLLVANGLTARISCARVTSACAGAALFLGAEYSQGRAGVTAHGERGKPAEKVAEEAVNALLACHRSLAAFDAHLADQLIVPAALAAGPSVFTAERVTNHLLTNAWVVEQFGLAQVEVSRQEGGVGLVNVTPRRAASNLP